MFAPRQARRPGPARRNRRLLVETLEVRRVMAWVAAGPFGATNGQVENIANRPVSGAMHALLAHPTNADVLYAGSTNGGVWKTTNATAASPNWTPTTDTQSSQSIGALAFDLADPTFQTVYAGNGGYSSFGRIHGGRNGLLKSTDGAGSWTRVTGGGVLVGKNISGIVANGSTIVLSINIADSFTYSNIGIFRSTNGGASFSQISGSGGTGLPLAICYDLQADPSDPNVLYTSASIPAVTGAQGVYKSVDAGATWTRVSNATMDALFTGSTSNVEIATRAGGILYAAIINSGNLAGLFRSANAGASWTQMDTPVTFENNGNVGLNPRGFKGPLDGTPEEIAGGQGAIHFSIVADPTDPNIVYVGGDRQPRTFSDAGSFPNSIGALDFSGRLFRGDASKAAGSQFVHLTHRNNLGAVGGGTASSSSPHADSRDMVFDANGVLIESDDGGVYRRTSPRDNTGDWFSMIGNLQNTEAHDVAYDTISNVLMTGNQDTGTTIQPTSGATLWNSIHTGDGGDVSVDEIALAGSNQSIRYTSFQNLAVFRRRVYDASGALVSETFPSLTVTSGAALSPQFRTPVQTNSVAGSRLLIQGANSLYESLNQGASIVEIGAGRGTGSIEQDALSYGGRLNGVTNPDVVWAASNATVVHRASGTGAVSAVPSQPTTSTIRDLIVDPETYTSATIVTSSAVFRTTNSGASWTNITGNLLSQASDIRSIAYIPATIGALVVGTRLGVYATSLAELGVWVKLSTALPNVLIPELEFDASDNLLVAGTFGRGVWTLSSAAAEVDAALPPFDFGDAPASYLVTLAQNGPRHVRLGPTLGAARDAEADGVPSANASGDNLAGSADEDGVTFTSSALIGQTLSINVAAPLGGVLNAWFDFDRNGTFDAGERAIADLTLSAGTNNLSVSVPPAAAAGASFARFRISTSAGEVTAPTGQVNSGEVEDYAFSIFTNATSQQAFYKGSYYQAKGGVDGATDTSKAAAKSGPAPQTLSAVNVTNNSQGINGVVLRVAGLTATTLSGSDIVFSMSPQGAFNEAANPPNSWGTAPAPSAIVVTPAVGATPATVRIEWPNNAIENRWLQVRIRPTANTGLAAQQTFYQGHLRGDIDGVVAGGVYVVNNTDIAAALPVGAIGTVTSPRDVDRNGFILNADFIIIRNSINAGLVLQNITIPAAGDANEGSLAAGSFLAGPTISAGTIGAAAISPSTGGGGVVATAQPIASSLPSLSSTPSGTIPPASGGATASALSAGPGLASTRYPAPAIAASSASKTGRWNALVDDYFGSLE